MPPQKLTKYSKSFKKVRSFDLTYTGGPIAKLDENFVILPKNGGLNILNLQTGLDHPLIENKEEDLSDFDVITSFCVVSREDLESQNSETLSGFSLEVVAATRSGLIKLFVPENPDLDTENEQKFQNFVLTKQWKALHKQPISFMKPDPTGYLLATGATDGSVRVWDIVGNFCTNSYPASQHKKINCFEFFTDTSGEEEAIKLLYAGEMNVDLKLVNLSDRNSTGD